MISDTYYQLTYFKYVTYFKETRLFEKYVFIARVVVITESANIAKKNKKHCSYSFCPLI